MARPFTKVVPDEDIRLILELVDYRDRLKRERAILMRRLDKYNEELRGLTNVKIAEKFEICTETVNNYVYRRHPDQKDPKGVGKGMCK